MQVSTHGTVSPAGRSLPTGLLRGPLALKWAAMARVQQEASGTGPEAENIEVLVCFLQWERRSDLKALFLPAELTWPGALGEMRRWSALPGHSGLWSWAGPGEWTARGVGVRTHTWQSR